MCRFSYFVALCSITSMVCVICVKYVLIGISVVIPLVNDRSPKHGRVQIRYYFE